MGKFLGNHITVLQSEAPIGEQIRPWLEPKGWTCNLHGPTDMFILPVDAPAMILMDCAIELDRRIAILASVRAAPGPVASTPILLLTRTDTPVQHGVSGTIPLPLHEEQAIAAIEHWTGPVSDLTFRDLSLPHYRLVRLAGQDNARQLLSGFADHAKAALARIEGREDVTRTIHNMAGLAGTMGYADLSRLWSAIDQGESNDVAGAAAATRLVMVALEHLFPGKETCKP